jgi:hypothetical protein
MKGIPRPERKPDPLSKPTDNPRLPLWCFSGHHQWSHPESNIPEEPEVFIDLCPPDSTTNRDTGFIIIPCYINTKYSKSGALPSHCDAIVLMAINECNQFLKRSLISI